ncbi:MAG: methyltransferase domain-containing protein [Candidatus Thiosymbion ectosymbiont of Robbea hypermnestra]|nr:methyltransferase domain-containing protein [Candidatus Thiosymbion ectosymbiont of Robbea hypermnestra]
MTAILGISAFYHDSAAALVVDGRIVAAAQEERFTRKKHEAGFPGQAIDYCLREAGLTPGQLDYVGFYDKPLLTFERLLETYLAYAPAGFGSFLEAMPLWLKRKLHLPREISKGLHGCYRKRYVFAPHHVSHAASAFYPSPYEEAAILVIDGVGEWATCSFGVGRGNRIELLGELHFPHSLGLLYSAFTYFTGFEVNDGEYKLMGLAPYGEPRYVDRILDNLLDLKPDGSFRLDMAYFNYCQGLTMTSKGFEELFGRPPRRSGQPITRNDMDLAASVQRVTEEIMLRQARHVQAQTGMKRLCLAGGVALNCVANGRILREGSFEAIWAQPAAGDAGGALGVAQYIWHQLLDNPRRAEAGDAQSGSLLGVQYGDPQIEQELRSAAAIYQRLDDEEALCDQIAAAIGQGQVVGWYQGRMEFGPRALGSRSILGDARNPDMQRIINRKVKFREGFRPFAPIVLAEHAHEYFDLEPGRESPYMLLVAPVRKDKRLAIPPERRDASGFDRLQQPRSVIPAVTHVDGSARIQTVDARRHGLLRGLLERFYARTGCPVLVNTSFNLGWDPIVRTPRDAYRAFMTCDMDILVMGHFVLRKAEQPATVTAMRDSTTDEVFADKLASPCVAGGTAELMRRGDKLVCAETGHEFAVTDHIPRLFWPHEHYDDPRDVTETVKAFYEQTPFPNYDAHDSVRALIEKSRTGLYARRLDETIPYNTDVLEVGCGTGQLTNFLGISWRRVIGADMCLNSLRLGEAFRREHGLARVRFMQMNLLRPALRPARFDVVLCNGVLHTLADPYGGFRTLVPLLKPGGHLVLGLYNRYGRLATDLRRYLLRAMPGNARWIDPILRRSGLSAGKRRAWFADQYRHPHETKHTFGEILRWFDETGIEFVRGIPALRPDDNGLDGESLFEPQPRGTALDRLIVQASEIIAPGQAEGGFFIMIGRKPG